MSIVTNVNSLIAQENLRVNNEFQGRTIQRLTSGYRINSSGDDAAGLAVANLFRSDIAELQQGVRNANDGLSQLQIIDGGLNNISKMLDRMKTLATQSASTTFTGDRNILNAEYQALLGEINRQAANVGLSTGVDGGRFNKDVEVYVGGGGTNTQSNSKISISLSGTSNRIDTTGLGLNGTSIAGGGATVVASNGRDLSQVTDALKNAATQTYTFNINDGQSAPYTFSFTLTGSTAGWSGSEAVAQLNAKLSGKGITASLSNATATSGQLEFAGDVAFTVGIGAASTAADGLTTGASTVENGAKYKVNGATSFAATAGGAETITVTMDSGLKTTVTVASGTTTTASALSQINAGLSGVGVRAVLNSAGTGIDFQSDAGFTIDAASTVAAQGIFATDATFSDTAPSAGSSVNSSALDSIAKLATSVTNLGSVQGKIGTAQNKLQYAIQLAQSQISGFSAAESRIRDADVASEAANLTKAQVMQQASLAAMAQANVAPQAVLALLRG
jgi:flagellin